MSTLFDRDLSEPSLFFILVLFMFLVISLRYFLIAGIFYLIFHIILKRKIIIQIGNEKTYSKQQFFQEVKWSTITAVIFATIGALTAVAWQNGYTAFYSEVEQFGYAYVAFSIVILMFIHETYYYWLHRLMHHPKIFKYVHKVHHNSFIPSPWTAFSFHPMEGLLEALILPIMLCVIPVHYITLLIYLMIMTISSVINHLNIEIYPSTNFAKWIIGGSHHSLHHSEFKHNFGLYFTFWDKLMNTESPNFKNLLFNGKNKN